MSEERKVGAPLGNQNARKHGFYSKVLTEEEKQNLNKAIDVDGLDDEIALLRVKIISIIENDPENVDLIVRAINTLRKAILTRASIVRQGDEDQVDKDKKGSLKQAVMEVLKDIAFPVGVGIGTALKK